MPALVGGFGNESSSVCLKNIYLTIPSRTILISNNNTLLLFSSSYLQCEDNHNNDLLNTSTETCSASPLNCPKVRTIPTHFRATESISATFNPKIVGGYLAGLIEGDGTFAVHDKNSTAKKYRPMIIIVFKKSDLPLAEYLQILTQCGVIQIKPKRGYVLWQISDIVGVYNIVNIINGYMRTPKIEALNRTIEWINDYIDQNKNSKLPSTKSILSNIHKIEKKSLDNSPIDSNPWLTGFTDSDGNFSINITKRSNKNLMRVQLYYRLEIRQTYHRLNNDEVSFFAIMSKIGTFLGSNVLSRSRIVGGKQYFSFIVTATNKNSLEKTRYYFNKFPLLSSKYLDYLSWCQVIELQLANPITTSYLDSALQIRKDFNATRTTYNWDHLKNSYLTHNL